MYMYTYLLICICIYVYIYIYIYTSTVISKVTPFAVGASGTTPRCVYT